MQRHLRSIMCSVSVVTVVSIHTMENDQRLNTLVHEGDTNFSIIEKLVIVVHSLVDSH